MQPPDLLPPDDVDRAFARLRPVEPPADLMTRIAARTYRPTPPGRSWRLWLALDAVALLVLAFLSVNLGVALHETGALEVLGILLWDASLLGEAADVVDAIGATLPWLQIGFLVVDAAAVAALSARLLNERSHRI